jgi:hypothetical protein
MLGVNLLVRLGRYVLAGPVADAGVLPAGYYRHLALAALEEEDFPGALRHLKWVGDPLLAQILVLRLRLLAGNHRRRRQAVQDALRRPAPAETAAQCRALLAQEDRALELLGAYEAQALGLLEQGGLTPDSGRRQL